MFPSEGPVPAEDRDYCVRLGKAKIVRPGSACTLLTSASMVSVARQVVEETGVDAEIIDLRSLDPTGLDWPLVEASIRKTNRVAVVEQVQRGLSLGARLTQEIQDRVFDYLDHEILHVTGSLSAPVVSAPLNRAALGGADKLKAALRSLTGVGG